MPNQDFVAYELTPESSRELQELLFKYEYSWCSNGKTIKHESAKALVVYKDSNFLAYSDDEDVGTDFSGNPRYVCHSNYKDEFLAWLGGEITTQQTTDRNTTLTTTNTTTQHKTMANDPYELMCSDLVSRVLAQVQDKIPDTEQLRKGIELSMLDEMDKLRTTMQGKLQEQLDVLAARRLIIEDRRTTPSTTKELNEPHHSAVEEALGIINSGCWCAFVGPSGGGKTLGAFQIAKMLDIGLVCIKQMTRIIAPHDLIGYMDAGGHYRPGAWTNAILGYNYTCNGIPETFLPTPAMIVVDEMDNANENVIMLLKAIATGRIMMPYGMQECNPKVVVVATMNTWGTGATREYVGRCAQDAALLNEFQFQEWNYDSAFEWTLLQQLFMSYTEVVGWKLEHMRTLLEMFKQMRANAERQGIRVIISTRNIINVAKMLICNPKWSVDKALRKSVYKGLKQEEIDRVKAPGVWRKHKDIGANQENAVPTPEEATAKALRDIGECPI